MLTSKPSASRSRCSAGPSLVDFKSVRLFADIAHEQLQALTGIAWQGRLPQRTVVLEQDAPSDVFCAVLEGTVEVFAGLDDQETVIDVVEPGSVLLLACVMMGIPYVASV